MQAMRELLDRVKFDQYSHSSNSGSNVVVIPIRVKLRQLQARPELNLQLPDAAPEAARAVRAKTEAPGRRKKTESGIPNGPPGLANASDFRQPSRWPALPADCGSLPLRVLVIEGNANARLIYHDALRHSGAFGIEMAEAANGEEGLELAGRQKFDCILLDHRLPDMSGLEFLEQLTEHRTKLKLMSCLVRHEKFRCCSTAVRFIYRYCW